MPVTQASGDLGAPVSSLRGLSSAAPSIPGSHSPFLASAARTSEIGAPGAPEVSFLRPSLNMLSVQLRVCC